MHRLHSQEPGVGLPTDDPLTFILKALLIRHEDYVANSERERHQMTKTIEALEKEKEELEQRNAETIKANRDLLNQLEQLNAAVATSDSQVQALTDTLQSAEDEIYRLATLAARAQSLEQQLIELEREQAALQGEFEAKIGDERTAVQRWRRAEKTIGDLQDQIDRIEAEARAERERHEDIVARMERRMAVSGELATVGDRSKAKAGQEKGASTVVSHFVKDILVDNAHLQHGIVELRQLLQSSNEEVELLREQLQAHQPVSGSVEHAPAPVNLKNELATEPTVNQELHIHHHYHGPAPKKENTKAHVQRRTRKKRISLTPGNLVPLLPPDASSTAAILSQTSVTVPPNMQRWSNATTLAPSSMPGSPLSMSHRGSIYDRVFSDAPYDSSRPTSPSDSLHITSPVFAPQQSQDSLLRHQKRKSQSLKPPSLSTIRSSSSPISLTTKSSPATAIVSAASPPDSLSNDIFLLSPALNSVIPEESEETADLEMPNHEADFDLGEALSPTTSRRPALRRAASHESLISVSGMDIHTLQSRPSQLLFSTSPRLASPSSGHSTQPVLTPWTATAAAHMSRAEFDSSTFNKSLLYGSLVNKKRGVSPPKSIGKKVGGWVFGKWGAAPSPSSPRTEYSSSAHAAVSVKSDTCSTLPGSIKRSESKPNDVPVRLRPPGVNQSGPIWGYFDAVPPTPTKVVVTDLDADALDDALGDL
jgi:predicted  nucleic acid-binding Zn-ribbon protein